MAKLSNVNHKYKLVLLTSKNVAATSVSDELNRFTKMNPPNMVINNRNTIRDLGYFSSDAVLVDA